MGIIMQIKDKLKERLGGWKRLRLGASRLAEMQSMICSLNSRGPRVWGTMEYESEEMYIGTLGPFFYRERLMASSEALPQQHHFQESVLPMLIPSPPSDAVVK